MAARQPIQPTPHRSMPQERPSASGAAHKGKRYRFEWSLLQVLGFGLGSLLVMGWMFVFGVLVGRDLPIAGGDEQSLRGQLVRFLGLPHEPVKPTPAPAAEALEDPSKVLEELDYRNALTQRPEAAADASAPKAEGAANRPAAKSPEKTPANAPQKATTARDRPSPAKEGVAPAPVPAGNEQHTLLVASLRSQDNAQKLTQQLRSKGYDPQLETLDKPDDGRWYRVLVGSFKTRDEAQRFAAEFNKRENFQGIAIRLAP
jgi:cell division septation protein DedD